MENKLSKYIEKIKTGAVRLPKRETNSDRLSGIKNELFEMRTMGIPITQIKRILKEEMGLSIGYLYLRNYFKNNTVSKTQGPSLKNEKAKSGTKEKTYRKGHTYVDATDILKNKVNLDD